MQEKKKIGKNKRKKDNKKRAIDEAKNKFNIGKEIQYESTESCTIDFYLIHRTSYNALYGANEEYFNAGGRSLYEVVISKNISPKDRILELYKKIVEIGGTNIIIEPTLQYKLNGIRSRMLISDIETLEKNIEDILDPADYYDRIIFKLDGCVCYLNVKHILGKVRMDRMLMESREDDSWKNTKARY